MSAAPSAAGTTIPIGIWLEAFAGVAEKIIGAVIETAVARVPFGSVIGLDKIAETAVHSAIVKVEGAVHGQVLDVGTGMLAKVVNVAKSIFGDLAPQAAKEVRDGEDYVLAHLAKLGMVAPDASAAKLGL